MTVAGPQGTGARCERARGADMAEWLAIGAEFHRLVTPAEALALVQEAHADGRLTTEQARWLLLRAPTVPPSAPVGGTVPPRDFSPAKALGYYPGAYLVAPVSVLACDTPWCGQNATQVASGWRRCERHRVPAAP